MGQLVLQYLMLKPVNWLITCSCEPTLPETEPDTSKGIIQAHVLQALKMLFRSKLQAGSLVRVHRGCSFVCRYVGITGLLSAPLRIGDWLCVLPAITLVVDKSKKLNKAVSLD